MAYGSKQDCLKRLIWVPDFYILAIIFVLVMLVSHYVDMPAEDKVEKMEDEPEPPSYYKIEGNNIVCVKDHFIMYEDIDEWPEIELAHIKKMIKEHKTSAEVDQVVIEYTARGLL